MSPFDLIPQAHAAVDMAAFAKVVDPIITQLIYPLLGLIFGLALIIFVWGVLQLVIHGDDETARGKGKMTILYGTIGMFIMVAAWGIIYIVSNTVKGLSNGSNNSSIIR
jgi:hypothetical protein